MESVAANPAGNLRRGANKTAKDETCQPCTACNGSIPRSASAYKSGFRAYDNWYNALVGGEFNPFGLRYLTAVYVEAKHLVAAYLHFLADTWPGPSGLAGIAAKFDEIAKVYAAMMPALGQDFNEGGGFLGRPVAAEQAAGLAKLVKEAKRLDQKAVATVKALLAETE